MEFVIRMLKHTLCLVSLGMLIMALCGCSTVRYLPATHDSVRTDTLWVSALRVDSVVERDSIVVVTRGDTVYKTAWRDRYRYLRLTDTVYRAVCDSVYVERVVEVEKPPSRWQKFKDYILMTVGLLAMICIVTRKVR